MFMRTGYLVQELRFIIECFRRNSKKRWVLYPYSAGEQVELASIGFRTLIATLDEDAAITENSLSLKDSRDRLAPRPLL